MKEQTKINEQKASKPTVKSLFSTRMLAGTAIFTALAYAVSLLEFSVFPASAVPFLKLDFSNVFIMLTAFMYGPISALFAGVIKELLSLIGTQTFGVGQIANMIVILVYVLPPSIIYLYKKGIKSVVISLCIACVLQIITALLVNRFITFPLYMDEAGVEAFYKSFWLVLAFNAIKAVSVSIITVLLYKRVGYLFEKIKIK